MAPPTHLLDVTLPSFGSSVGNATLVEWHITEGADVVSGQVIADIETDKAVTELEAPDSGVIEEILVAAGTEDIDAGTVLARIRAAGKAPPIEPEPALTAPAQSGPTAAIPASDTTGEPATAPAVASTAGVRVIASPYARALAAQRQVALDDVPGSGPGGRIVSRDIRSASANQGAPSTISLQEAGHHDDTYALEPASRMRRAIATNLSRSMREIPSYSLEVDLELDHALEYRNECNKVDDTRRISLNDIVVLACARALSDVPAVNSAWTDDGVARFRHANIAIAVATDTGLVAPVVKAAEKLSLEDISVTSRDLVRRAQEGRLGSEELRGATFTVSNLGMRGIRAFTSIPAVLQGAILSVGAAEQRPVVRDGEIAVATLASFTLTCDHRVIDGAVGARFLQALRETLDSL